MEFETGGRVRKYRVLTKLAVGGMAEIYLAVTRGLEGFQKHAVLKRILPEYSADPRFVEMFLDEARLAARFEHQNIAQVYDFGETDGGYFYAMEYLHGHDLRSLMRHAIRRDGRIPLQHAITIVAGAASGLHYAHELCSATGEHLHIVHRDVSLSNVIVSYTGSVKLVDFGVAKASQRASHTCAGSLKGKIAYMSPEQCLGGEIDNRSDVFSLGIVLYEISTGTRLFRADRESDFQVMERIVHQDAPLPSERIPGYPKELERIVMRALARDRDQRYPSASDLLTDLEQFATKANLALSSRELGVYLMDTCGELREPWRDVVPRRTLDLSAALTINQYPLLPGNSLHPGQTPPQRGTWSNTGGAPLHHATRSRGGKHVAVASVAALIAAFSLVAAVTRPAQSETTQKLDARSATPESAEHEDYSFDSNDAESDNATAQQAEKKMSTLENDVVAPPIEPPMPQESEVPGAVTEPSPNQLPRAPEGNGTTASKHERVFEPPPTRTRVITLEVRAKGSKE